MGRYGEPVGSRRVQAKTNSEIFVQRDISAFKTRSDRRCRLLFYVEWIKLSHLLKAVEWMTTAHFEMDRKLACGLRMISVWP